MRVPGSLGDIAIFRQLSGLRSPLSFVVGGLGVLIRTVKDVIEHTARVAHACFTVVST